MATDLDTQKEVPKRLTPTKETLNLLFALSGNQCAFPGCEQKLFNSKNKLIAHVCHIEGALTGGERFNLESTNEKRRHFDNLLTLCLEHHVETDDEQLYKVQDMRKMKVAHEQQFKNIFAPNNEQIDNAWEIERRNSLIRIEESNKRIEDSTSRIETGLDQNTNHLLQLQAKMDDLIAMSKEPLGVANGGYDSKLDKIFVYRTKSKPQTAIEQFNALRKDDWQLMNDKEKYRLLALTGICYIDLLDTKSAAELFIEGLSCQPNNIKAISFGILGYTIIGDSLTAHELIEKGLAIDPLHSGIWSSKIRLSSMEELDSIVEGLPEEAMGNTVEIPFELARKFREKKDYKSSFKWLKVAQKCEKGDKHEIFSLHATFLLESIFDNFKIISQQISSQVSADAQTAVNLYTTAWDEVKNTELASSRAWFLQNRGIAKKILGDMEGYYDDMVYAANVDNSSEVQMQLLRVCLELGKINKAKDVIAQVKQSANGQRLLEIQYIEAHQLMLEDKLTEALELLESLFEQQLPEKLHVNALLDTYGLFIHFDKLEEAEECVIALETIQPDSLSTLTLRARIDAKLGRGELKIGLLSIKEKVNINMPAHEIQIFAEDLAKCNCYREAAELYELIVDKNVYSPLIEKLLHYYNIIGENAKILTIARELLDKYGPIRLCTELVSYVYERIRDEQKAIDTCLEYLKVYPDDQQLRLRLALIYDRERNPDALRSELEKIEHLDKNLSLRNQFTLARLLLKAGLRERARAFVYEARRQFYDKADAHEHFFAFHLDEEKLYPSTTPIQLHKVEADSVVTMKISGNITEFILEERTDGIESRGERSIQSFEGKALMGRKIGDLVAIHPNYSDHFGEILSIMPKFDFAGRESLRLMQTVFSNQTSMRSFQFPESGDPAEMKNALFDILEKHGGNDSALNEYYQSGNFPIGAVAAMKGKNPVELWMDYAANPNMGVHSMIMLENFEQALQQLEKGCPIVIEIVGLLTLFQVRLHEFVQSLPNRKIVLKSTFDLVQAQLDEFKKLKGTQIINLLRIGNELVQEVKTEEDIDEHILFFEQLIKWIEDSTEVVPCEAALKMNWIEKQKYDDAVGESCVDTILTAEHITGLLFAEESSIRGLAKSETGVEGLCTFQLAFGLLRMKLISFEDYQKCVFLLVQLNEQLIPASIGVLTESAEFTRRHLVPPLTTAIKGIVSANLSFEQTIITSADFIGSIASFPNVNFPERYQLNEKMIIHVLDVLCENYETQLVYEKLAKSLSENLLISKQRMKVMRVLDEYFYSKDEP